jgi:hypothetical protein
MSADPKVSVVMPVHNGEPWLADAIASVLQQTLREFELIVVDDGSTDASPATLVAMSRRDARVRAVRLPQREGLVSALNRGLGLARAPLLARLDADDGAAPERLARQAQCFDARSTLVLLGSWAERIDESGRCIGHLRPETDSARLTEFLQHANPMVHSSVMMRTALAQELGGYREPFLGAEDFDLWLRMAEHGGLANLPLALVRYRVHDGNVGRRLAVRQCFSARLARAAAAARGISGADPAARLTGPPDWWTAEAAQGFAAEAAQICRFLDLSDRDAIAAHPLSEVRLPTAAEMFEFSHAEKQLARRSLLNLLATPDRPAALASPRLIGALITLLVGRAARRAFAARRGIARSGLE